MIYCVGGVSGTGKSTLIHNHPQLKELKHIDIAQAYQEAEERDARISWQEALEWLIDAAARQLLIARQRSIVLEAFFRPGKEQRERVKALARQLHQQVQFIWCHAPRRECYRRVRRQHGDSPRRRAARNRLISYAPYYLFYRRWKEDPDRALDSTARCERCGQYRGLEGPNYRRCERCIKFA